MKIEGAFKADMTGFRMSYTKSSNLRLAHVQVTLGCDAAATEKLFGDELAILAFGAMRTEGGEEGDTESKSTRFGYSSMKPDMVCAHHLLAIDDDDNLKIQPSICSITPVDGEEKVNVVVEFPISVGDNVELTGRLATKFKKQISVKLEATQMPLPFVVTKAGAFGNPEPRVVG